MKKAVWRKHHKWFGLVLGFFIVMFSLSGLVLNHPSVFSGVNVSRSVLPSDYLYDHWNRGLLHHRVAGTRTGLREQRNLADRQHRLVVRRLQPRAARRG